MIDRYLNAFWSSDVIYFTTGRNFKLRLMISETPQNFFVEKYGDSYRYRVLKILVSLFSVDWSIEMTIFFFEVKSQFKTRENSEFGNYSEIVLFLQCYFRYTSDISHIIPKNTQKSIDIGFSLSFFHKKTGENICYGMKNW